MPPSTSASAPAAASRYLPVALLLCVTFVVEGSAYGVLAPLLPVYRREVGLTVGGAGVITGAFSAGMLPASIALFLRGGRLTTRWVAVAGLALMAFGSVAMAGAGGVNTLTLARLLQGIGSGAVFAGALRWLLEIVPPSRRATWFGLGWGALNGGTIVGPVVGGLAARYGLPQVLIVHASTTALFAVALTVAPARMGVRVAAAAAEPAERGYLSVFRPLYLLAAPAIAIGMANTLSPLRMADRGLGRDAIALVFLAAAGLSVVASPVSGHWVDRRGPRRPLRAGLLLGAALSTVMAVSEDRLTVAIGTILVLGLANEVTAIAVNSLVNAAGSANGHEFASATLLPIVYAVFETLGAFASGPLTAVASYLPFAVLAAAYLVTALLPASGTRQRVAESTALGSSVGY